MADKPKLSMGCKVGDPPRRGKKLSGAFGMSGRKDASGNVEFHSVSWVPAPRCDACGYELVAASSTLWKCPNAECGYYDETVHVGVYPAFTSSES
jgi:hypothetical protein